MEDVSDPQFRLHRFLANYGYLRVKVAAGRGARQHATLRIEFHSPDIGGGQAADAVTIDLVTHEML